MKLNNFVKLIIAVGVCELAGVVGSMFTVSAIPTWYAGLVKPALNPPSWVFGISKPAAYLLILYIFWVSFALYLNYSIWILN